MKAEPPLECSTARRAWRKALSIPSGSRRTCKGTSSRSITRVEPRSSVILMTLGEMYLNPSPIIPAIIAMQRSIRFAIEGIITIPIPDIIICKAATTTQLGVGSSMRMDISPPAPASSDTICLRIVIIIR